MSWTAIPASAAPLTPALTPGSSPAQLSAFAGGGEQAAIAAAGTGISATTTPADPSVAAGGSDIVEAVDSAVFVYSRTGGSALATFDINTLVRTSAGWAVKNPKVVYDPSSSRFILAVVQYNTARSGCTNAGSQIEVVASNADPTTAWQTPRTFNNLASLGGATPVALNVSLGMTSTVVALAWDYASCATGNPVASQTDIVQRADLATGTLGVNSARAFTAGPLGVQPAMALGLSTVEYEIANDSNCMGTAANQYEVFTYTGTPAAKNVAGPTCAANGVEGSGSSAPPAAAQSGTGTTLQTGDDRFLDAVWGSGALWATGNTGCMPGGSLHSCVNVVTATATTLGSVSAATQLTPEGVTGADLYYPSLALDSTGNAILTFDKSSSSTLESMQVASINGGAWSSFIPLHTSAAYYAPSGCPSPCSWGAYSGAVQDPLHPTDVWVVSADNDGNSGTSCATVNTCWNTYVGRYTFAAPSISSLTPVVRVRRRRAAHHRVGIGLRGRHHGHLCGVADRDRQPHARLVHVHDPSAAAGPERGVRRGDRHAGIERREHGVVVPVRATCELRSGQPVPDPRHETERTAWTEYDQDDPCHRARNPTDPDDGGGRGSERDGRRGERHEPPGRLSHRHGEARRLRPELHGRERHAEPRHGDPRFGRRGEHLQLAGDGQRACRCRGVLRATRVAHERR